MKKLWNLYLRYKEQMNYIIIGGLTTVVNFVIYAIDLKLGMPMMPNLVVSWIAAVLFAYVTNRTFVFESKEKNIGAEFAKFVSSRIASLLIEMLLMEITVNWIGIQEMLAKIAVAFVVVIVNYVLSKIWVFKK